MPPSDARRKAVAFNAMKHGLTGASFATNDTAAFSDLTRAFSNGCSKPEIVEAARRVAELQTRLSLIRQEKAAVVNRQISSSANRLSEPVASGDGRDTAEEQNRFSEASAICSSLAKLTTLDSYERKTLSRRRKAALELLLAFERASRS